MTKLGSQQSSVGATHAASYARPPLPPHVAPASDTIAPLWAPVGMPREIFPEWPGSAALAGEQWGTADALFEDTSVDLSMLPLPHAQPSTIQWKRPCQFLPPIAGPTPTATASAPVVPDPKHAVAKKGAPTPAPKKGPAYEPESLKKPAPKYAHIFFVDAHEADNVNEHKKPAVPTAPSAGHGHGASALVAAAASVSAPPLAHQLPHIPREFRRLWSAEELEALGVWTAEEARIAREKENHERVLMAFENAIAYIVNERPRKLIEDDELNAEDLIDNGEDDEDDALGGHSASLDSSPFGVLPPPRIEIAGNAAPKPEIPHGEVVHREMASYFYVVEQLWSERMAMKPDAADAGSHDAAEATLEVPFLWQAIYPQDTRGAPIYNPGGRYAVKLFVLGKWRRVDVDDKLPVDLDGNIVYLTSAMRGEIWAALLTKALQKVLQWLRGSGHREDHKSNEGLGCAVWQTKTILSALTGWNVTRWNQRITGNNMDSVYQLLREYIPIAQVADDTDDCLVENDAPSESKTEAETTTLLVGEESLKPRALLCCTDSRGLKTSIPLAFREAALVTDIVGEPGNMELKIAQGHGQSICSVPEELIAMEQAVLLLLHAPQKHETHVLQQWTQHTDHAANDAVTWIPPANPPVQFLVVHLPPSPSLQCAGDSATEPTQLQITHCESKVNLVATLTRIHPVELAPVDRDVTERQFAQCLGVDPDGSLILMEERFQRAKHVSSTDLMPAATVDLPRLVRLDTTSSTHISFTIGTGSSNDHVVFRLVPQWSLGYGYALQAECSEVVELLTPETYWRNRLQLQVIDCEGSYPVLSAGFWHVLFKHTIEIAVTEGETCTDLFLDLYVSEALLVPFVHVSVVNDHTTEITHVAALCSIVKLPLVAPISNTPTSSNFTVIIECRPQQVHVREGTWKLTLGSRSHFKASSTHSMSRTSFEGQYEPNKPLICFRDVVTAPKKSIWTSMQVELFTNEVLREDLAVKLAVYELKSEQLLHESSAMGEVQALQLPKLPERPHDDAAYVVQCTIDRSRCVVPDELFSVRPFRDLIGSKSQEPKDKTKIDETSAVADEAGLLLAPITNSRAGSNLKWRLTCWSAEPVVLEVDRTKEKRFDAVRFMWAENAKDRDTNGSVSRLLYLGHTAAAEAKMRMDNMSDEQIAAARNRVVWLKDMTTPITPSANVSKSYEQGHEHHYLAHVKSAPEEHVLTAEELEEYHRREQQTIDDSRALLQQRREAREIAKSQRAQNVKDLVQSVKEKRATAAKKRLAQMTMHQNPASTA